jgi:replication factor A2
LTLFFITSAHVDSIFNYLCSCRILLLFLNKYLLDHNNSGMDYQGGGADGGGFGAASQSQGTGGKARRSYDEQNMLPCTIGMILSASTDESGTCILSDGRKAHHVKFVGASRNAAEDFSTNVIYQMEDGTGLVEVKQWLDDNACSAITALRQSTLKEHIYLKVVGQIKEYDGKKMVVADSVRLLTTPNELTHHMLEVVYSAETYTRKQSLTPGRMMSGVGFGQTTANVAQQQQYQPMSANGGGGTLRDTVMQFIREEGEQHEAGANVPACIRMLSGKHTEGQVRQVIEELSSEGHIYSTINEDNYKSAMM